MQSLAGGLEVPQVAPDLLHFGPALLEKSQHFNLGINDLSEVDVHTSTRWETESTSRWICAGGRAEAEEAAGEGPR